MCVTKQATNLCLEGRPGRNSCHGDASHRPHTTSTCHHSQCRRPEEKGAQQKRNTLGKHQIQNIHHRPKITMPICLNGELNKAKLQVTPTCAASVCV